MVIAASLQEPLVSTPSQYTVPGAMKKIDLLRSICVGKILWIAFRVAPKAEKRLMARAIFEYANAIADEPDTVAMLARYPELREKLRAAN